MTMALSIKWQILSMVVMTALLASPVTCVSMYPYGVAVGDTVAPPNDDGSTAAIPLSIPGYSGFKFFYSLKNNIYINTNGHLTFDQPLNGNIPSVLPYLGTSMIMPFQADIDTTRNSGRIYYRQTTDATLLSRAATDLTSFGTFVIKWLFIATWLDVTYYGVPSTASMPTNTFQVVLITDGSTSFTMFNYLTVAWNVNTRAQAGYNYGDLINYYAIPSSLTSCTLNMASGSNVGHPGRFIYQITPGCSTTISPPTGLAAASKIGKRSVENEADKQDNV